MKFELLTASLKKTTNVSTEHSPSWEANVLSSRQEIPHILRNTKSIADFSKALFLTLQWARRI
jgi:hypothetical protein